MPMTYAHLSAATQRQAVEQRAAQLELEHFQNALAREELLRKVEAVGLGNLDAAEQKQVCDQVKQYDANLTTIETAHAAVTEVAETLPASSDPEQPAEPIEPTPFDPPPAAEQAEDSPEA